MSHRSTPLVSSVVASFLGLAMVASAFADDGAATRTRSSSSKSTVSSSSSGDRTTVDRAPSSPRSADRSGASDRSGGRETVDRRRSGGSRGHDWPRYDYRYNWPWYGYGWYPYPFGYGAFWWGGWGWGPSVVVVRDYGDYRTSGGGALDTDVHPEEAEIWVDGERLGIADNFDGFPEYLWLPEGDHEVVIYHPGYRTIHREYSVYDGVLIEVDDRMDRGEATPPGELFERATPRRDTRIERDRDRRVRVDRSRQEEPWRRRDPGATSPASPGDWRERGSGTARAVPVDRGEGRVVLAVQPPDASLYLDGAFLGLARDWTEFLVEPGRHRLDVVRPGYESAVEEIDVEAGGAVELAVELDED